MLPYLKYKSPFHNYTKADAIVDELSSKAHHHQSDHLHISARHIELATKNLQQWKDHNRNPHIDMGDKELREMRDHLEYAIAFIDQALEDEKGVP